MIDTVVVRQGLDEPVAEAGLADADGPLLLLSAGQSDDGDGQHPGGAGSGRRVPAT